MKQNKLFFLVFILLCGFAAHAQTCPDFTNLHGDSVKAFYSITSIWGITSNPFEKQGIAPKRHTLIDYWDTDPNTGGALEILPQGETQVIRLGNDSIGGESEALRYTFTVDKDNSVLLLKFAVVLEDPNHIFVNQPRFIVRITDTLGNLTEPCAEYDVTSQAGIPGFKTVQTGVHDVPVHWRDWTNVGLDLSKFAGKKVRVEFITHDCNQLGHFGYCYFTARCMPNVFIFDCTSSFEASAPEHFESYLWDNGDTSCTTKRTEITSGKIWCRVTSATGCQFTLTGTMTSGPLTARQYIDTTICEGEPYTENHFNLPPQAPGEYLYYHTLVDPNSPTSDCDMLIIELKLKVIKRFTHFRSAICKGENYIDTLNGFKIIQPAPGVYRDTVWQGKTSGCDSANVLELTVSTIDGANIMNQSDLIKGDSLPCSNDLVTYSFAGSEMLTHFYWVLPENAVVVKGSKGSIVSEGTPQITLFYSDDRHGTVFLYGENGCGGGSQSLNVRPRMSYNITFKDTACQGEVFSKYGFNLGVQNNIGKFVYTKDLISALGCDSSVTLTLQVSPKLEVRIVPKDPILCKAGEPITLLAITGDDEWDSPEETDNVLFHYNDCNLSFLWSTGNTTNTITEKPMVNTLYTVTANFEGCKTTAKQLVVVDPDIFDTICPGEDYIKYGLNILKATTDDSGTYSELDPIIKDTCVVNIVVHLYVRPPSPIHHITGSTCAGEWFTVDDFHIALYQVGVFRDTLHFISHTGCDSLVTFEITVNPVYRLFLRDTVCQNQTVYNGYGFKKELYNIAGEFNFTRPDTTVHECDSIINLKLTVNPVTTNIISDEIEAGADYNNYGFQFPNVKKDTTDTKYLQSSLKCDSTVILNLKVTCKTFPALPTNIKYGCKDNVGFIKITDTVPNYEYSINGTVYRSDGNFQSLLEDTYYIHVRNKFSNCETISTEGIVISCVCIKPAPPKLKSRK